MADMTTVRAKIAAALDEADAALGNKTVTEQLAELTAQREAAVAAAAALQAKINAIEAVIHG